jgi:5-methylcytosine-specific restriction endonuclease McrA
MPTRLCSNPTCAQPATYRGRCAIHSRANEQGIQRTGLKIYSTAKWQRTRRKVLFLNPLCACGCGDIATDVDHIVPLDEDGDPWDMANLQGLTAACHARKTRQEQTTRRVQQEGSQPWLPTPSPATPSTPPT